MIENYSPLPIEKKWQDFFENNRKSLLGKLTDKTYYSDKTNNLSVSLTS